MTRRGVTHGDRNNEPGQTKKYWLPWRATGRPKWRATSPIKPLRTAIPSRCAPRSCAISLAAEQEHAALWAERIKELGGSEPMYHGSPGGEADSLANRAGGIRMALRRLEIEESRHIANYGEQLKALGDEGSIAILDHVIEDEKEHYRELGSLLRGHYTAPAGAPKIEAKAVLEEMLAKRNQGRKQPGAWIGDAIYGVNDGLGAIFGIVSGVSGATAGDSKYVLLAGLSGMIASALSMGSGAYLAAKSEREIYQAEVAREREAIADERPRSPRAAFALLPGQGPARGGRAAHGQPHCQRPRSTAPRPHH